MRFYYLSVILCPLALVAMQEEQQLHAIILPGQNGLGGESFAGENIINIKTISSYKSPKSYCSVDLGQANCIKDFDQQLRNDTTIAANSKLLLYGISQGTATVVNWLAQQSQPQQRKIACVFLEAILGSGNSAIMHTTKNMISSKATSIPFARAWLPWIAKIAYPSYNPCGTQAISSIKKIDSEIPMILVHNAQDPQLSINDARTLYCKRRKRSDKVYLFEAHTSYPVHINVLGNDSWREKIKKLVALQLIYKKYGLPYHDFTQSLNQREYEMYETCTKDLTLDEFQPSIDDVKKRIANNP